MRHSIEDSGTTNCQLPPGRVLLIGKVSIAGTEHFKTVPFGGFQELAILEPSRAEMSAEPVFQIFVESTLTAGRAAVVRGQSRSTV